MQNLLREMDMVQTCFGAPSTQDALVVITNLDQPIEEQVYAVYKGIHRLDRQPRCVWMESHFGFC